MRCRPITKIAVLSLLALLFTACDPEEGSDQPDDNSSDPASMFTVDTSLSPSLESLDDRQLFSIVDDDDIQFDFVAGELIFVGDEGLDEFLDRWDATVTRTVDFEGLDEEIESLHHVTVDSSQGDIEGLPEFLEQLGDKTSNEFVASDDDALGLLAISLEEKALRDHRVILNAYMPSHSESMDYVDDQLAAADNGDNHFVSGAYSPNPSDWFNYNSGTVQDIGVTDAWRALAMAGLTDPDDADDRIRLAILDGGFLDLDLPPGSISPTFGAENIAKCGGSSCPWHGTAVAQVAVADPHSGEGIIGTGGPVGTATMLSVPGDVLGTLERLEEVYDDLKDAAGAKPRIMNISAGFTMNSSFDLGVSWLFGKIFDGMLNNDILPLASAGNAGIFMNEEDCGIFGCSESHVTLPCQANGVVCIGGLDDDSRGPHSSSNHGQEVDLWAPYRMYVGIDTDAQRSDVNLTKAHAGAGTSYSSPYVAGVAALVMAADPSLSARQVRDLLYSTGRSGVGHAHKYVQARTAVYEAMGGAPFSMELAAPSENEQIPRGTPIHAAVDFVSGGYATEFQWNIDSTTVRLGASTSVSITETVDLSLGSHDLEVTATAGPYELTRQRTFEIVNNPPSISIEAPSEEQVFYESSTIPVFASTSDVDTEGGELLDSQVTWRIVETGQEVATGHLASVGADEMGVGTWTLEAVADDGHDTSTDTVSIDIVEDPEIVPPEAVIIQPEDGEFYAQSQAGLCGDTAPVSPCLMSYEVELEGYGWEGSDELSGEDLVWRTVADENNSGDESTRILGEGSTLTATLYHNDGSCAAQVDHEIQLTATDSEGISRTVSAVITLSGIIC